jgi:CheY-like chemotaxis protein
MTIARQLISMMNGKISAKSEVGEGSTFTIKIPQKISGNNVLGKEAVENLKKMKPGKATASIISPLAIEPMPYGKVLVVDDIESNLYVVEGYLHPYQVQLETVTSGMEAIEKIKAGNVYDVIFMDHMMPEMDGLEATKTLREMGYSHPIVALTANTIKGAQELFMNNGFAGFIAKPIDIFQLNSQLVQHIRDKQTPEVLEAAKLQAVVLPKDSERPVSDKIAKSFLRDAERAIEILQQFVKLQTPTAEELKAYSIQAHGMKSALMNIEKPDLSKKAAILEAAANKGDTQTILSQTQEFINNVQAVKEELAPPESNEETHDEDPDLLKIQLQVIYDACELYDKKSFRNALKALREKTWSAKTNEALSALEAHLLRSEFEEAGELAKTLCS